VTDMKGSDVSIIRTIMYIKDTNFPKETYFRETIKRSMTICEGLGVNFNRDEVGGSERRRRWRTGERSRS
jgi:hypothetical protein